MNINLYKEYTFFLEKSDGFHEAMRKYIIKEKFEKLSRETIDRISINDEDKSFFEEKSFTLSMFMLVTDVGNRVDTYTISIKNVKVSSKNLSKTKYDKNCWQLDMYELVIPAGENLHLRKLQ